MRRLYPDTCGNEMRDHPRGAALTLDMNDDRF
jgi:hypothetical protein